MTPYQRGNRDGLLNLVAHVNKLIKLYEDQLNSSKLPIKIKEHDLIRLSVLNDIHRLALRQSEALPEDPEEIN